MARFQHRAPRGCCHPRHKARTSPRRTGTAACSSPRAQPDLVSWEQHQGLGARMGRFCPSHEPTAPLGLTGSWPCVGQGLGVASSASATSAPAAAVPKRWL